jgi:hypothetical protein
MKTVRSRLIVGLAQALCASLALSPAGSARAAVTYTASMTPSVVSFPSTTTLSYSLTVKNPDTVAADFVATLTAPAFEHPGLPRPAEGSPFRLLGVATTGSLIERSRITDTARTACTPQPGPDLPPAHGFPVKTVHEELTVPPLSEGRLTLNFAVGRWAPWAGMNVAAPFEVSSEAGAQPTRVAPAGALRGTTGVRIEVELPGRVRRGGAATVRGRIFPALAHRRIVLRWRAMRAGAPLRTLGAVRTDKSGRFRVGGWRPPRAGTYEVWAFTRAQPSHTADYACPSFVLVG